MYHTAQHGNEQTLRTAEPDRPQESVDSSSVLTSERGPRLKHVAWTQEERGEEEQKQEGRRGQDSRVDARAVSVLAKDGFK